MQAVCNKCSRLSALEVCFECNSPLCRNCIVKHFEAWKNQRTSQCFEAENELEAYKKRIETFSPVFNKNLDTVKQIEDQIEEVYKLIFNKLAQEKKELVEALVDVKKDNMKFLEFKKNLTLIGQNLNSFREISENLYEDNMIKNMVEKYNKSIESVQKVNQNYLNIINAPLKCVERFDPVLPPKPDTRYIGRISTTQQNLTVSSNNFLGLNDLARKIDPVKDTLKNLTTATNIFPLIPSRLDKLSVTEKMNTNFDIWANKTEAEPTIEIAFDRSPVHLTTFRNFLYCLDDQDCLTILAISSTNDIQKKDFIKMPLPPQGIAVNMDYVGVTFTNLNKKYLKNKHIRPSGVVLYKKDGERIDFANEKIIDIGYEFKSPKGIAMNNDYVFVCDREHKAIFKIDIKSGSLIKRIDIPNGEPYKISLNKNYVIVTDILQHSLNVYEIETLSALKNLIIEQPDGKNGPFTVFITEDNIIFIKNYQDAQLIVFNFDLTNKYVFKKIKGQIQGLTVLQVYNQMLVIGVCEKRQYKLLCYANA